VLLFLLLPSSVIGLFPFALTLVNVTFRECQIYAGKSDMNLCAAQALCHQESGRCQAVLILPSSVESSFLKTSGFLFIYLKVQQCFKKCFPNFIRYFSFRYQEVCLLSTSNFLIAGNKELKFIPTKAT